MITDIEGLKQTANTCTLCELHLGRKNPVFDKGNPETGIFICGMVPADEENEQGIPFVGRAGKLLDEILKDADLSLNDVYITNLVKCYLAAGKPLKQDWIDHCLPYLVSQIMLIKPKAIITLGKDSTIHLLGENPRVSLAKLISSGPHKYLDTIDVLPAYHPSFLLRKGGKSSKDYVPTVDIFKKAKNLAQL